jgi:hypothetical protein
VLFLIRSISELYICVHVLAGVVDRPVDREEFHTFLLHYIEDNHFTVAAHGYQSCTFTAQSLTIIWI